MATIYDKMQETFANDFSNSFTGEVSSKPETEQKLFQYQEDYYKARGEYEKAVLDWEKQLDEAVEKGLDFEIPRPKDTSKDIWQDMYLEAFNYCHSLVLQRCTKKFLPPEEVNAITRDATTMFMQNFLKDEGCFIGASFAGMLHWPIVTAMYKPKNVDEDRHVSLNEVLASSSKELGDIQINFKWSLTPEPSTPEDDISDVSYKDTLKQILTELDEVVGHDSKLAFIARLYLTTIIRGPKNRHVKRLFLERWSGEFRNEQVLETLQTEVYNQFINNH